MSKAQLTESYVNDDYAMGGNRRIWIVRHNGQSKDYKTKREARKAKSIIDSKI